MLLQLRKVKRYRLVIFECLRGRIKRTERILWYFRSKNNEGNCPIRIFRICSHWEKTLLTAITRFEMSLQKSIHGSFLLIKRERERERERDRKKEQEQEEDRNRENISGS